MRVFIAIDIDESIRARIATFIEGVAGFAPDARWVRPESLHLTLKFIGERSEAEVETIKKALAVVKGESMQIGIRGYGFFPTLRSPRVFWIGVEAGPQLQALAAAVDEATASLGIPKEDRPFSPHLTLGTWRRADGVTGWAGVEALAGLDGPVFRIDHLVLYRSHPGRQPRYEPLRTFALTGTPPP